MIYNALFFNHDHAEGNTSSVMRELAIPSVFLGNFAGEHRRDGEFGAPGSYFQLYGLLFIPLMIPVGCHR
jgi:hypothetical protein